MTKNIETVQMAVQQVAVIFDRLQKVTSFDIKQQNFVIPFYGLKLTWTWIFVKDLKCKVIKKKSNFCILNKMGRCLP